MNDHRLQQQPVVTPVSDDPADPIQVNADGIWFYDEIWIHLHGPYASEPLARQALKNYAATL